MARLKIQRNRKSRNGNLIGSSDDQGNVTLESGNADSGDGATDSESIIATDGDSGEGSGDATGDYTIPGDISGTGTDSGDSSPRRRGRPKGSGAGRTSAKKAASDLDAILFHAHLMLASFCNVPELKLSETESERYAAASQRVIAYYSDMVMPEKTMAWVNLGLTLGGIYGPKYIAYTIRSKRESEAEKSEPQKINGPQVSNFTPINFPTGAAAHA